MPMSKEEFKREAQKIYDACNGYAGEQGHINMDELMYECLKSLGYDEGLDILFSMHSVWYA